MLFQRGVFVLQLLADRLILGGDLLQRLGKGQKLIQVGGAGKQGDGTAVVEHLHSAHTLLEIRPALVVLRLLGGKLLFLDGDLVLFVMYLVVQLANLPGNQVDLIQNGGFLLLQLLFDGRCIGSVGLCILELLVDGVQLLLQGCQILTHLIGAGGADGRQVRKCRRNGKAGRQKPGKQLFFAG